MDWTNENILEFIELLQVEPSIWDINCKDHKRRESVNDAWERIQNKFSVPCSVRELKKKRNILLTQYRDRLKRIKESNKPGTDPDDLYKPTWFAFNAMHNYMSTCYNYRITGDSEDMNSESKKFSLPQLQAAMAAVKAGLLSQRAAAVKYSIPRRILINHLKAAKIIKPGGGRRTISNADQDNDLGDTGEEGESSYSEMPQSAGPTSDKIYEIPLSYESDSRTSMDSNIDRSVSRKSNSISESDTYSCKRQREMQDPRLSNNQINEAFSRIKGQGQAGNECDLYGQLIAEKLKPLQVEDRLVLMNEIDNLVFNYMMNLRQRCSSPRNLYMGTSNDNMIPVNHTIRLPGPSSSQVIVPDDKQLLQRILKKTQENKEEN